MPTIHYSRCRMVPTPSSLAASVGILDRPWLTAGTDVDVSVEFGDFDHRDDRLWMRHAGSAKSIWARSEGADTHVVMLSSYRSAEPITVLANSDIRVPADLRGKRVALPRVAGRVFDVDRTVYLMPLASCLASAGLVLGDVELVDTAFERPKVQNPIGQHEPRNFFEAAAGRFSEQLLRGDVDAMVGVLPPDLQHDPRFRTLYDTRDDPRLSAHGELRMLTVSGALLREHRPVVVEALARVIEASRWGIGNPGQVAPRIAGELSISQQALDQRAIDFEDWLQLGVGTEIVAVLEARKDAMLAAGVIARDFSVDEWVDRSVFTDAARSAG